MLQIGAHVSISDGFDSAVSTEEELGGNVGQVFVGSPRGWKVKEITESDRTDFQSSLEEVQMGPWIVHGTYLINFATPKDDLAEKSIQAVQGELDACSTLGIPYYVFHPGSHTGAGEETGVENVAERLSELDIPNNTMLLLENTAGKGTTVGKTFEQLDQMVELSTYTYDEVGICLDTCHLFSAGYDFRTEDDMDQLVSEATEVIGIENIQYLHLNDSKHPLGSEKDEHEHIGEGEIGEQGFRNFINHSGFRELPMVLETPEDSKGYAWNIKKVRSLYE
ncbi:deoxyribonuclease IV [Halovenus marina]|uniref:deoxyribonuclease IV n=1 Tax=Halovenus marina TaxID=3396621 RepID=UPI003F549271